MNDTANTKPTQNPVRLEFRIGGRRGPVRADGRRGEPVATIIVPPESVPWLRKAQLNLAAAAHVDALWCFANEEQLWTTAGTRAEVASDVEEALHLGDRELAELAAQLADARADLKAVDREREFVRREMQQIERQRDLVVDELRDLRGSRERERGELTAFREACAQERRHILELHEAEVRRMREAHEAEGRRMRESIDAERLRVEAEHQRLRTAIQSSTDELARVTQAHGVILDATEATTSRVLARVQASNDHLLRATEATNEVLAANKANSVAAFVRLQQRLEDALEPPKPQETGPDPIREGYAAILQSFAKTWERVDLNKVGQKLAAFFS